MEKSITTDLNAWAAEAKKYNINYGQYVSLSEIHGILPTPKRKPPPEPVIKPKIRTCLCCGNVFELTHKADGKLSTAKLCESCRGEARKRKYGKD